MANTNDQLAELLTKGWVVVGYSVAMMAAGAMTHCVLVQGPSGELATATIGLAGQNEIGRHVTQLSPAPVPAPKKGFWG